MKWGDPATMVSLIVAGRYEKGQIPIEIVGRYESFIIILVACMRGTLQYICKHGQYKFFDYCFKYEMIKTRDRIHKRSYANLANIS